MCRVLVGLGSGGFLPTALAFVVESTPTHRRNFVVAIVSSGVAVGGVAAAVLGAALPMLGYRFIFLVGLVPLVVLVPIVVARVPESISYLVSTGRIGQARATVARHRFAIDITEDPAGTPSWPAPSARGAFASLFTREFLGAALVFWFGTAFCMVLIFGANTWLPSIMLAAGYGLTSSLVFLAALNLGVVVGSLITAWLAERSGPKMFVLIGFATCVVALVVLALRPPAARRTSSTPTWPSTTGRSTAAPGWEPHSGSAGSAGSSGRSTAASSSPAVRAPRCTSTPSSSPPPSRCWSSPLAHA